MTKYNKETSDQIVELIRAGNFQCFAWKAAGISHQTFHRWLKEHREFREAIKKAKGERVANLVTRIARAAEDPKTWTAAAWLLCRLSRKHFDLPTMSEIEFDKRLTSIEEKLNNLNAAN